MIKNYQGRFLRHIPLNVNEIKAKLIVDLREHIKVMSLRVNNPTTFIKVADEVDILDDKILEYSSTIHDLEKIQELYEKIAQV